MPKPSAGDVCHSGAALEWSRTADFETREINMAKRGRKPIKDEFTDKPVSRQRKWQLRKARQGKCRACGKTAVTLNYCREHADKAAEFSSGYYYRKKSGQ